VCNLIHNGDDVQTFRKPLVYQSDSVACCVPVDSHLYDISLGPIPYEMFGLLELRVLALCGNKLTGVQASLCLKVVLYMEGEGGGGGLAFRAFFLPEG
jgi:hypothetical protein